MQTIAPTKNRELVQGCFWIALALLGFVLSFGFDEPIPNYRYGAASWPRALLALLALLGVCQVLWAVAPDIRRRIDDSQEEGSTAPAQFPFLIGSLPVVYIATVSYVGFYLATPFLLLACLFALGERRPLRLTLVTAAIYGFILLVFGRLLYLPLPVGNLPGFYEINNWILIGVRAGV
ncbi:tripartite tricarboxylate transporter TctB family protein [Sediminicurvatus halobius]|uniref:DUF1468 domain-containing protein n=1 Tax=Sediminicurvatus halobius TaxID=2182432 RepID=A0A2U2MXB0_9GAMM|nr:tripartite tricarboxylate transporter TctB family protein [Spiribacter halobius]PWG61479.1 hypothetical protein DEM34_16080 [Spiribacter halobius]UEX77983.1 tripartite tricarboxylate transporter TctB family protein [Spiribacter halobius]